MIEAQKTGEVTNDAVGKARRWLQEHMHFDTSPTIEMWVTALSQIGFENAEIEFSGFHCEGDGASFTCNIVNVGKLASFLSTEREAKNCVEIIDGEEDFRSFLLSKAKMGGINSNSNFNWIAEREEEFEASVIRTGYHYKHSRTCIFEMMWRSSDRGYTGVTRIDQEIICDKLRSYVTRIGEYADFIEQAESLRRALSDAIYEDLEADYSYFIGDQSLVEISESNDYGFDEFGDFVRV
jgi:hypothetical protein